MAVEVLGIDHVQAAVLDLERSEALYDRTMPVLGFRKRKAVSRAPIPAASRSGPPLDHIPDINIIRFTSLPLLLIMRS